MPSRPASALGTHRVKTLSIVSVSTLGLTGFKVSQLCPSVPPSALVTHRVKKLANSVSLYVRQALGHIGLKNQPIVSVCTTVRPWDI